MTTLLEANLSNVEKRMLSLYAAGEELAVVQETLHREHGLDFSAKDLGCKMGKIKSKMKCQTQFEMGFVYAHKNFEAIVDSLKTKHETKLLQVDTEAYNKGYSKGFSYAGDIHQKKDNMGSMIFGIVISSIFWIVVMYLLIENL